MAEGEDMKPSFFLFLAMVEGEDMTPSFFLFLAMAEGEDMKPSFSLSSSFPSSVPRKGKRGRFCYISLPNPAAYFWHLFSDAAFLICKCGRVVFPFFRTCSQLSNSLSQLSFLLLLCYYEENRKLGIILYLYTAAFSIYRFGGSGV